MQPTVFLSANCVKAYQLEAKDSEIKSYSLCLGTMNFGIKDFTVDNIKNNNNNNKKTTTKKTNKKNNKQIEWKNVRFFCLL